MIHTMTHAVTRLTDWHTHARRSVAGAIHSHVRTFTLISSTYSLVSFFQFTERKKKEKKREKKEHSDEPYVDYISVRVRTRDFPLPEPVYCFQTVWTIFSYRLRISEPTGLKVDILPSFFSWAMSSLKRISDLAFHLIFFIVFYRLII